MRISGTMEAWEVYCGRLGNAERTGSLVQPCHSTGPLGAGRLQSQNRCIGLDFELE